MKHNQNGAANVLMISTISCVVLLIAALIFGIWAFSGRQQYKNNAQQLISAAVSKATHNEDTKLNAAFANQEKSPLNTYYGPQAYGSLIIGYPKTWSGYVDDTGSSGSIIDGYFGPGILPALNGPNSVFALRFQVLSTTYSQILDQYQGNAKSGLDTVAPYQFPKVPSVVGVQVSGRLLNNKQGIMIIMPLRSNTLELWTESTLYSSDFSNFVLPNVSFSP